MEASVRTPLPYTELSLAPEERIPESFWTSLRYFNLYRMVLAGIFLGTTLLYGDAFNLGLHSLEIFRYVAAAYLLCSVVLQGVLRDLRDKFELQLSVQAGLDLARDHASHVGERRHAQRPRRDAADLADGGLDRRTAPARLPLRRARHHRAAARAVLLGAPVGRPNGELPAARTARDRVLRHRRRDQLARRARRRKRAARAPARPPARHPDARQPAGDRGHAGRRAGARSRRPRGAAQSAGAAASRRRQAARRCAFQPGPRPRPAPMARKTCRRAGAICACGRSTAASARSSR